MLPPTTPTAEGEGVVPSALPAMNLPSRALLTIPGEAQASLGETQAIVESPAATRSMPTTAVVPTTETLILAAGSTTEPYNGVRRQLDADTLAAAADRVFARYTKRQAAHWA